MRTMRDAQKLNVILWKDAMGDEAGAGGGDGTSACEGEGRDD